TIVPACIVCPESVILPRAIDCGLSTSRNDTESTAGGERCATWPVEPATSVGLPTANSVAYMHQRPSCSVNWATPDAVVVATWGSPVWSTRSASTPMPGWAVPVVSTTVAVTWRVGTGTTGLVGGDSDWAQPATRPVSNMAAIRPARSGDASDMAPMLVASRA